MRDSKRISRLVGFTRPYRFTLGAGLILLLLLVAATNAMPLVIKVTVDGLTRPGTGDEFLAPLLHNCLIMLGLAVAMFVFRIAQMYLMTLVGQYVLRDLREEVFRKIMSLPMRYFDTTRTGVLMTRVTSDLDALQQFVRNGMIGMVANLLLLVGAIIFMTLLEWRMALALFSVLPILGVLLLIVNIQNRKAQRATRSMTSELNSEVQETLTGLFTLRIFGRLAQALELLTGKSESCRKAQSKAADWASWHFPVIELSRGLAIVVLLIVCGFWLPEELGSLVAFLYYVRYFFRPLEELAEDSHLLQSGLASAERVFAILDEPGILEDPETPKSINGFKGGIQFEKVDFSYDGERQVLHGVSFNLHAGQSIAIVGATGSGKSTLINLLCRFYDPTRGRVCVDGVDLREFEQQELRRFFGIVQQDPMLFAGSVTENICMGVEGLTAGDAEQAARYVNAHRFIEQLPEGYETKIGESGVQLSTGQKQLIALARALAQGPEVMILLDEATANVDSETEALIQDALHRLMADRTSIVIAHRLSTIQHADQILVMKDGRLLEQGTHQELLHAEGYYRTLVDMMRHGSA